MSRGSIARVAALLPALLLWGSRPASTQGQPPQPPERRRSGQQSPPEPTPGEILVKFRNAVDADELATSGALRASRRPGLAAAFERQEIKESRRLFAGVAYRRLDRVVKVVSERARRNPAQ